MGKEGGSLRAHAIPDGGVPTRGGRPGRSLRGAAAAGRSDGIGFKGGGPFYEEVKGRARGHLADRRRARRAQGQMYAKSVLMLAWSAASWWLLMFAADTWWQAALLVLSLGLALAGIGFNMTHDANHGAFAPRRWINRSMRWSLDLIGASSYVWRVKHNVVHHTYTNISGADGDIEQLPFL